MIAAVNRPVQEKTDHPTQRSIHYHLGINIMWEGQGGGVRGGRGGRGHGEGGGACGGRGQR